MLRSGDLLNATWVTLTPKTSRRGRNHLSQLFYYDGGGVPEGGKGPFHAHVRPTPHTGLVLARPVL